MSRKYSKGTIKIKNKSNDLDTFYPKADISGIIDETNEMPLEDSIDKRLENYTEIYQNGGIEIVYDENINAENYFKDTLFALVDDDIFNITVITNDDLCAAIPFNLYKQQTDVTLYVDWGDGTTSTLTSADYMDSNGANGNASIHKYSKYGTYNIKVASSNWSNTFYYHLNTSYYYDNYRNTYNLGIYNSTLKSINSKLPKFSSINVFSSYSTNYSMNNATIYNDCSYMFSYCTNLTFICEDLFKNYSDTSSFYYCFYYCTSLTSIPEDLFKYNIIVTNFNSCFYYCSSLTSIPRDLFKYNTAVTDFSYCFCYCSDKIEFIIYIGSTNVTNAYGFLNSRSIFATTRNIYALSGSTTYTTFYNAQNSMYSTYTY